MKKLCSLLISDNKILIKNTWPLILIASLLGIICYYTIVFIHLFGLGEGIRFTQGLSSNTFLLGGFLLAISLGPLYRKGLAKNGNLIFHDDLSSFPFIKVLSLVLNALILFVGYFILRYVADLLTFHIDNMYVNRFDNDCNIIDSCLAISIVLLPYALLSYYGSMLFNKMKLLKTLPLHCICFLLIVFLSFMGIYVLDSLELDIEYAVSEEPYYYFMKSLYLVNIIVSVIISIMLYFRLIRHHKI